MHLAAHWRVALVTATVALTLVMSAVVGATAIERRMALPSFELGLGPARISAFVTQTPNCRTSSLGPNKSSLCSGQSIYSPDEYFAVWVKFRSKRGSVTFEQARRLVLIRLGDPA
jgi:hypothetical protein